jgi:hypothetical protein
VRPIVEIIAYPWSRKKIKKKARAGRGQESKWKIQAYMLAWERVKNNANQIWQWHPDKQRGQNCGLFPLTLLGKIKSFFACIPACKCTKCGQVSREKLNNYFNL